jgi:hypothetical protein
LDQPVPDTAGVEESGLDGCDRAFWDRFALRKERSSPTGIEFFQLTIIRCKWEYDYEEAG